MPREVQPLLGVRTGDRLLFQSNEKGVRVRPVRSKSSFSKYRGTGNRGIESGRKGISRLSARAVRAMTTTIDTNVAVALWDKDPTLNLAAQTALAKLEVAFNRGNLEAVS